MPASLLDVQLRQSCIHGDRPERCPHCGQRRLHLHGHYKRYPKADGARQVGIPRYLCAPCGRTCSVLPNSMLPYRPIEVSLVQSWFDAALSGETGPPVTEKERGCLHRALRRFGERVAPLRAILGQMLKVVRPTAQQLWQGLREWGNLEEILHLLARNFKTSLLGHYRCLQAG